MTQEIVFDRRTGALRAPDFASALQARLMQAAQAALKPVGLFGISRAHGTVNAILKPKTDTVVKGEGWSFRYPSDDYYWNRLLDAGFEYEPEIDRILRAVSHVPFTFIDLGANFGFWSAKMGGGVYGEHPTIAVEASDFCLPILKRNVAGLPVTVLHKAVDDTSGKQLNLYSGKRHAGASIDSSWSGASHTVANTVETVTIDDLNVTGPSVVKLDVEGVELRALKGATKTAAADSLWLIECAERHAVSEALIYAKEHLGMSFFLYEDGLVPLDTWEPLLALKTRHTPMQGFGVNTVATASPMWLERLHGVRGSTRA